MFEEHAHWLQWVSRIQLNVRCELFLKQTKNWRLLAYVESKWANALNEKRNDAAEIERTKAKRVANHPKYGANLSLQSGNITI